MQREDSGTEKQVPWYIAFRRPATANPLPGADCCGMAQMLLESHPALFFRSLSMDILFAILQYRLSRLSVRKARASRPSVNLNTRTVGIRAMRCNIRTGSGDS